MPDRQLQINATPGLWPLTWPMGLTMLRLVLLPLFLWLMLSGAKHEVAGREPTGYRWAAVGVFAVMAITDKLDGYLARKLNQTSRIGTLLDPVADKLLIACSVILLSFDWVAPAGYAIPMPVVITVYAKDLIVVVAALGVLYGMGRVTINPRPLGKLSTFLQLTLVLATLLAPDLARLSARGTLILVLGLWWTVSLVAVASCADYLIHGVRHLIHTRDTAVIPAGK